MSDDRQRLRDVLAAYGADPARWPARDREDLSHLRDPSEPSHQDARAVDRLLGLATAPEVLFGAEGRVIRHVHALRAATNRPALRWTAAVPLAGSLLLGIYLGGQEELEPWLPGIEQAAVEDDDDDLSGVGEAETYAEENLT